MSGARSGGGWAVAACIGAVETMKDQGVCRMNNALRSVQQQAKSKVQSYYQTHLLPPCNNTPSSCSSSYVGVFGNRMMRDVDRDKRTEASLKKVMYLSCWGPNTVRF